MKKVLFLIVPFYFKRIVNAIASAMRKAGAVGDICIDDVLAFPLGKGLGTVAEYNVSVCGHWHEKLGMDALWRFDGR